MKKNVPTGRIFKEFESNDRETDYDGETSTFSSPWKIPLPSKRSPSHRNHTRLLSPFSHSSRTPLLRPIHRQAKRHDGDQDSGLGNGDDDDSRFMPTSHLFGDLRFLSPRVSNSNIDNPRNVSTAPSALTVDTVRPEGLAGWFFGFMYEDSYNESFDFDEDDDGSKVATNIWNPLNMTIFASYALTTAAQSLPILLIPAIGQDFLEEDNEKSAFSSHAASSAVLGIACGKFLSGQVADFLGARRTSSVYSILLAVALLSLALSQSATSATTACFYVEFFQSVQWPCIIVILGTHYSPPNHATQYENGIFLASIASRFGALVGIPVFSILLRRFNWRLACLFGAWMAAIGSSIMFLYGKDSPSRTNDPQNPLHPNLLQQVAILDPIKNPKRCLVVSVKVLYAIIANNILPSFRHVLKSGTFWIVALAHTGSTMARTAERILGTYFHDTSNGYVDEDEGGGLAIFLSLGTILGLVVAGKLFTQRKERQRKMLVSRLYMVTIVACYALAVLAIPRLRQIVDSPDLILFFQVVCSVFMGFGISVMYSLIPGLVGSAFGKHRGSYIAYTDGVAFGVSSVVWKVVASAVTNGNAEGGGWAYGWAAVALLIVLSAILMVEFMEHYFVRPSGRHSGTYETMIFA
jgi:MFS family permease